MNKTILIWIVSGLLYVGVVFAGFGIYTILNPDANKHDEHATNTYHE